MHHWQRLRDQLEGTDAAGGLRAGVEAVREMLKELEPLTASRGLYGGGAVQGSGARLGRARSVVADRFLERNQALRFAVHDVAHVCTLLAYLAVVSEARDDSELPRFCRDWQSKLESHEDSVRSAAVSMGRDADAAIRPVDDSPLGHAAHGMTNSIGTFGEWLDRRTGARRTD